MTVRGALDLSLMLVTDAAACGDRGVVEVVAEAVAGGVGVVQLRDKRADDVELLRQVEQLARVIDGRAALIVNDRLDVVLAARARGIRVDGVHLGQGDGDPRTARDALGPDAIIGLTANTAEHLAAVAALPPATVDYLGVGVIRPTSTKPDHPLALGLPGFAGIAAATDLPCVAIGGVRATDASSLRRAGAAGVAVVSAVCAAPDPRAAAARFAREWTAGGPAGIARVLSIAGSDPSGGAGIQADLKSIAAVGGYGMAAITALTAQHTRGVRAVHVPPAEFLLEQLDAITDDIAIDAVKIGMLADADVIDAVAGWLRRVRPPIVVLDPVMVATSGDRLLDADAERALRDLVPLADLVTPNVPELAVLAQAAPAGSSAELITQAESVSAGFGVRVLAKGGHLSGPDAPDVLVDASTATIVEFARERIATTATHGTGCSLSSAVATLRATNGDWVLAVGEARRWLRESLRHGESLAVGGGHGPVHHFAGLWARGGLATAPTADEVAVEWWDGIADLRAAIDELPFVRGLADGTLPRDEFLRYLAQDAVYLGEYARTLAIASSLAPDAAGQTFWARSAVGSLEGELDLHASWLGEASVDALTAGRSTAADATTAAYLEHLAATAGRGDYAVLAAALLPCFQLYVDLGDRLAAGEFGPAPRDARHPYASWIATYADPAFASATREATSLVARLAATANEHSRRRMYRAYRISAEHEVAFFTVRHGVTSRVGTAVSHLR